MRSFDPSSDTALEEFAEVVRGMHQAKLAEEQRLDTAQPVIDLLDDAVAARRTRRSRPDP